MLTILDLNDNAPEITVHTLTGIGSESHVPENAPVGTFVAHVTVHDPDHGRNGTVNCSLPMNRDEDVNFTLMSKHLQTEADEERRNIEYQILTAVRLDREVVHSLNLTIVCWDGGNPARSSVVHIPVIISDDNDNKPRFAREIYTTTLVENNPVGADVIQVRLLLPALYSNSSQLL